VDPPGGNQDQESTGFCSKLLKGDGGSRAKWNIHPSPSPVGLGWIEGFLERGIVPWRKRPPLNVDGLEAARTIGRHGRTYGTSTF